MTVKADPHVPVPKGVTSPRQLVDPDLLWEEVEAAARAHEGNETAQRKAVLEIFRRTLAEGREEMERRLKATGKGTLCAAALSYVQDVIIETLYRFTTTYAFPAMNPTEAERLSIVAVGGYGRGTLAPGSDIDLLFLRPYKQTPWGESVVEYMLYMLWDMRLKVGHATRSIEECIRLATADITIRTAMLEARYLWGDRTLFDEMKLRFDKEIVANTAEEFVEAKLAERDERHARAGESRYLVEPNIKDGKGGLRDLQTLFWIAKYVYQVETGAELVSKGVLTKREYNLFRKAEDFLWAVRCHLHFLTGRAEERLSFDVQPEMARRLGYVEHAGMKDVERFMKHYFLVAKDVGDLTRIFCSELEEAQKKKSPTIGRRLMRSLGRVGSRPKKIDDYFVLDSGRLNVVDNTVFEADPVNLIRLFHIAEVDQLHVHPDVLKLVTRSLKLINADLRKNEEANRLFLEILTSRKTPERGLRRMNEAGVLGRFVPDFGRIVALMQFNMYHHYTADEHLLRSIGVLSEIERGALASEHPLADELIKKISSRPVLYLAMLLHDIAKGRPEDHSIAGEKIAKKLGPRLGLSAGETETVAWLVRYHLVMSDIAQRRDISDPKTVRDFADIVQSVERLRLLLILTVADIKAVGPGVWNGWKGQLLRQLYYETESLLTGGHSAISRGERVDEARQALRERLDDWGDRTVTRYLKRHYDPYWLSLDTDTHEYHARLIRGADQDKKALVVDARTDAFGGITELTVYTTDHPGLFLRLAGACAVCGANIVDAKIFTTADGMALDIFSVQDAEGHAYDEKRRLERLRESIEMTLAGEILPPQVIDTKIKRPKREQPFKVEPQVFINNEASDYFTVIEVNGRDRPGLLYDLTRALSRANVTIVSAHITTYGERAVDVFYVKDVLGGKITHHAKKKSIERHLTEALGDAYGTRAESFKMPGKARQAADAAE